MYSFGTDHCFKLTFEQIKGKNNTTHFHNSKQDWHKVILADLKTARRGQLNLNPNLLSHYNGPRTKYICL